MDNDSPHTVQPDAAPKPSRAPVPAALRELMTEDDTIIVVTRQHLIVRVGTILAGVATFAVMLLVWLLTKDVGILDGSIGTIWGWLLVAIAAYGVMKMMVQFVAWRMERLVITEQKLMHMEGIIRRRVSSTPLVKIDQLDVHQGLLGRMLGFGDLMTENAAGGIEALEGLGAVPKPFDLYRIITDNARRQRVIEGGGTP